MLNSSANIKIGKKKITEAKEKKMPFEYRTYYQSSPALSIVSNLSYEILFPMRHYVPTNANSENSFL